MSFGELNAVCWVSLMLLAFTWFQPLLLGLDSKRTCGWITLFAVTPVIAMMALPERLDDFFAFFPMIVGTTAVLAATLLPFGQRTRHWLGFLAGLAFTLGFVVASAYVFGLFGGSESWAELLSELRFMIAVFGYPDATPLNFHPKGGVPSLIPGLVVMMVANVLFGIPLIFGTKPIARRGAESASMPGRLEAKT
jgi:hypothetical protein